MDQTAVIVEIDKCEVWRRFRENGNPGGFTSRSRPLLEKVAAILREALQECEGQLDLMIRNP